MMMPGLSCEKTAQLLSETLDRELPWFQRLLLAIHLLLCKVCKESAQQIQNLHQIYSHLTHPSEEDEFTRLPQSAKQRISGALKKSEH